MNTLPAPLPDESNCYTPDAEAYAPEYDPAAAAAFLDEAGYKVGADGKRTKPDGSELTIKVVGNLVGDLREGFPDLGATAGTVPAAGDGGLDFRHAICFGNAGIAGLDPLA